MKSKKSIFYHIVLLFGLVQLSCSLVAMHQNHGKVISAQELMKLSKQVDTHTIVHSEIYATENNSQVVEHVLGENGILHSLLPGYGALLKEICTTSDAVLDDPESKLDDVVEDLEEIHKEFAEQVKDDQVLSKVADTLGKLIKQFEDTISLYFDMTEITKQNRWVVNEEWCPKSHVLIAQANNLCTMIGATLELLLEVPKLEKTVVHVVTALQVEVACVSIVCEHLDSFMVADPRGVVCTLWMICLSCFDSAITRIVKEFKDLATMQATPSNQEKKTKIWEV